MRIGEIRKQICKKVLTHQDSNLERQNQNLLCYHYTMGQDRFRRHKSSDFPGICKSAGAPAAKSYWILAIDMISANTPAAVTEAPAPYPLIWSGYSL